MLDFMDVEFVFRHSVNKVIVKPKFNITLEPQDLIVKNGKFYAIWDEEARIWRTDMEDAIRLIDKEIDKYISDNKERLPYGANIFVEYSGNATSSSAYEFMGYVRNAACGSVSELDQHVIFRSGDTTKGSLSSMRLSYDIKRQSSKVGTYYWDIVVGALLNAHDKDIFEREIGQKLKYGNVISNRPGRFLIIDGAGSSGKSTLVKLIEMLLEGYSGRITDGSLLGGFRGSPLMMLYDGSNFNKVVGNGYFIDILQHRCIREKIGSRWGSEFFRAYYGLPVIVNNSNIRAIHYSNLEFIIGKYGTILKTTGDILSLEDYEFAMNEMPYELPNIAYKCMKKA